MSSRSGKARSRARSIGRLKRLARVCVAVARGAEAAARLELRAALREGAGADLREAILQTHLFAGFPRAINGLWLLNELDPSRPPPEAPRVRATSGEALCRRIYGRDYEPMMRNLRRLHPELAEWILADGYGKVLSRPYFTARERELMIVPTLVAMGAWRQVPSHLKGTLRVGGTAAELASLLRSMGGLLPASSVARALALLEGS